MRVKVPLKMHSIINLNSCIDSCSMDISKNLKGRPLKFILKKAFGIPMHNYFLATYKDCCTILARPYVLLMLRVLQNNLTELFLTTPRNTSEKELERQLKEAER